MQKKTKQVEMLKELAINLLKDTQGNVKRMNLEQIFKLPANSVKNSIEEKHVLKNSYCKKG